MEFINIIDWYFGVFGEFGLALVIFFPVVSMILTGLILVQRDYKKWAKTNPSTTDVCFCNPIDAPCYVPILRI